MTKEHTGKGLQTEGTGPTEGCKHSLLGVSHTTWHGQGNYRGVRGRLRESRDHWNGPTGHSEDFRFPPESDKEPKKDIGRPQRYCAISSRPLTKANTTVKPAIEILWFPSAYKVMMHYTVIC